MNKCYFVFFELDLIFKYYCISFVLQSFKLSFVCTACVTRFLEMSFHTDLLIGLCVLRISECYTKYLF